MARFLKNAMPPETRAHNESRERMKRGAVTRRSEEIRALICESSNELPKKLKRKSAREKPK